MMNRRSREDYVGPAELVSNHGRKVVCEIWALQLADGSQMRYAKNGAIDGLPVTDNALMKLLAKEHIDLQRF